jgi:hypothetical protein
MSFDYQGLTAQEISDAFTGYMQLLITKDVGPTIVAAANNVLADSAFQKIASVKSEPELWAALASVTDLAVPTHALAKHFALRDENGRGFYAVIKALGAFDSGGLANYPAALDQEAKSYLNEHKNVKANFKGLPDVCYYYPNFRKPPNGTIAIPVNGGIVGPSVPLNDVIYKIYCWLSNHGPYRVNGGLYGEPDVEGSIMKFGPVSQQLFSRLVASAPKLGLNPKRISWKPHL